MSFVGMRQSLKQVVQPLRSQARMQSTTAAKVSCSSSAICPVWKLLALALGHPVVTRAQKFADERGLRVLTTSARSRPSHVTAYPVVLSFSRPPNRQPSIFASNKAANVAAASLAAVSFGTAAWYTSLYGNPLLPEAYAESAADHGLHPPSYPWAHKGPFETFDHAA